jgi:PAS domain S-box-containing protein
VKIRQQIDEEKRVEQRLRESESRLQAAADLVGLGWSRWEADSKNVVWDARLRQMWGLSPDAPIDFERAIAAIHPEDRHMVEDFPSEGADPANKSHKLEYRVIGIEDGTERWIRTQGRILFEPGSPKAFVGAVLDITEQKRAERALRESESRLKAAVDLVNLGLYSWDPQTNEMDWDKAVKAMWGLREDAPITYDMWRDAVHPVDLQRVEAAVAGCIDPRNGSYDVEYRVIGITDRLERWIATRGRTEFENGTPVSFHGVALDVTNRKRTENALEHRVDVRTRELEEANAALISEIEQRRQIAERLDAIQAEFFHAARLSVAGQMAAVLAHELSQPLTATLNSVNTLRRLLASSDLGRDMALRELIEEAAGETERAGEIVRRLRFFIRRGSVDRTPEAVAPMIEEAVAFAAVGPNALGVTISQYFDPLVPTALVDRVQIQQVISNLVRNSLEALKMQSRRELSVASAPCGEGYMEVIVSDNGPGVTDEMKPNLFEPFNTNKPDGMGLGLSICKSIVEAHGGRIAYTPSLDGGSAFRFTLECAPEAKLQ